MQRQPVKSSNLAEVGFEDGVLEISFKDNQVYRYHGVPEELYQSMLGASSVGNFFNNYIKTFYRTEKVAVKTDDEAQAPAKRVMPSPVNKDKGDGWDSNEERLSLIFATLAYQLTEAKPTESGELARRYAIVITEIEKAQAYFNNFILGKVI